MQDFSFSPHISTPQQIIASAQPFTITSLRKHCKSGQTGSRTKTSQPDWPGTWGARGRWAFRSSDHPAGHRRRSSWWSWCWSSRRWWCVPRSPSGPSGCGKWARWGGLSCRRRTPPWWPWTRPGEPHPWLPGTARPMVSVEFIAPFSA